MPTHNNPPQSKLLRQQSHVITDALETVVTQRIPRRTLQPQSIMPFPPAQQNPWVTYCPTVAHTIRRHHLQPQL